MSPTKAKKQEVSIPEPVSDPKGFYVGTSGWAYDIWQPTFYPEGLPKTKYLTYYSRRLTACEVNYTFRSRLLEKTAAGWATQTPTTFRFACKANQFITHIRRLKDCEEPVRRFAESMQPLGNARRLGPSLFQLPPTMKADAGLLREFLALVPGWLRAAFEFRHESWFTDEIYKVLADRNAALCVAETEEITTPDISTTTFRYYRFRRPDYPSEERSKLAERVAEARKSAEEVYVFFKHEERPESPLWAVELLERVLDDKARTAEDAELPRS